MSSASRPIGVFDSGVGGLTVVRALRRALPDQDVVYLGDTARVPYGSKSPRTVERYSLGCLRFLLDRRVKLVLIACNTASANALEAVTAASPVDVIGAVEPGARRALETTRRGRVGVLGTLATIRARAYEEAIARRDAGVRVTGLACPLLVPLAEEGWTDGDVATAACRRYLQELFERDPEIDTLVLGCTHYPLLTRVIAATAGELSGRAIQVVDSASAMADAAAAAPVADGAGAASLACFVTDASRLDELAPRFLGEDPGAFELVDL